MELIMPKNYATVSVEDAADIFGGYNTGKAFEKNISFGNVNININGNSTNITFSTFTQNVTVSYNQKAVNSVSNGMIIGALAGGAPGAVIGAIVSTQSQAKSGNVTVSSTPRLVAPIRK